MFSKVLFLSLEMKKDLKQCKSSLTRALSPPQLTYSSALSDLRLPCPMKEAFKYARSLLDSLERMKYENVYVSLEVAAWRSPDRQNNLFYI